MNRIERFYSPKEEEIKMVLQRLKDYKDISVDNIMKLYPLFVELIHHHLLREIKVKALMNPQVIYASPQEDIKEVIIKMAEARISGLPVVEDEMVIGVISESDLLRGLNLKSIGGSFLLLALFMRRGEEILKNLFEKKVKDIMTSPAIVLHEEAPVEEVILLMKTKGINRIPVVNDQERLVGIVTRENLLFKHPLFREVFSEKWGTLRKTVTFSCF